MRIGRTAIVGAIIAATTAGTMLVAVPSAMAAPGNCTISYTGSGVSSLCTSGTGHQQIVVVMYQANAGENAVAGNWAAVGQVSTVYVPWTIVSAYVNLRNS